MNWIDKCIGAVSPQAGLRRVRARLAWDHVQKLTYDGAVSGRRNDGWNRPGTSANAEIGPALKPLREAASDLCRNNPLARKAIWELQVKTVGTGIRPQARSKNKSANKILDAKFEAWAKECNADGRPGYYGMQALGVRSIFERGDSLLRYRQRLPSDGLTIPLQLQLLEGDFLDHAKNGVVETGYIIQGVEFDKIGRRVAYWLFGSHPGNNVNTNWFGRGGVQSARVPASEIEHGYILERIGAVRGVTWFQAVIASLSELDGYQDAERVRKRVEACLAAFVSQPEGEGNPLGPVSTNAAGQRIEEFAPGMVTYLPGGSKVDISEPGASSGYSEYVRVEQHEIAAGLCLLFPLLTGDLSQSNYSSNRFGALGLKAIVEFIQWEYIIPFICEPVWKRFVDMCRIAGFVPTDTDYGVEWAPPAFELLDRAAESEADTSQVRNGTMSWGQAVARQGYDPEKQLAEIAYWNKKMDDAGVIVDTDPRRVARTGAVQKNADGGVNGGS